MAWDLRAALLKKGEIESARLDDFEFRVRARTMRLFADRIGYGVSGDLLCGRIAAESDEAILAALAVQFPDIGERVLLEAYVASRDAARAVLISERGDPTPHRLA